MMRETKLLPSFFVAFALCAFATTTADASVSVALSLDEVAKTSTIVARVVPHAQSSAWENGRIVTTTRLGVERVLGGTNVPAEIEVRTLGGRVGDIGQIVDGEAQFTQGTPSIVFLVPRASDGALFVSGRAQGQLVVVRAKEGREVVRVQNTGALVPRHVASALVTMTALDGRDANDAMREAARAWERTHAR
jgi:hypothetical protein